MKMASYSNGNETYFHKKGFALKVSVNENFSTLLDFAFFGFLA